MQQEREQRRDIGRPEQKSDENQQWASIKDSAPKSEDLSKVKITNGKKMTGFLNNL